jgi:hypothetical protein
MNGPALFEEQQWFSPWIYVVIGAVLLLLAALLTLHQTTRVQTDSVVVRFGFLYKTRIPLSEIRSAEAVAYCPIREYGGWGIRGLGRRRALNTRGNKGVLLTRTDGSTLMIGSQQPRELLSALSHAGVQTVDRLPTETREF